MNKPWTKDSTPLFSVLIANYNNGQYLEECLQSVFDQTYTNWEIIIVDDGSTDKISHKIYQKYSNEDKIRVFKNKENKGCGYTKRRCVAEATGELCGFLDPDDYLAINAIDEMVKGHHELPNASLVYSTHFQFWEGDNDKKINEKVGQVKVGTTYLNNKTKVVSHFAAFKLEKYSLTSGINSKLPRAVDQDLYYKLEEVGSLHYIDKPLYYYRRHPAGISTGPNMLKARKWHLWVIKDTYYRRKKNRFPLNITKKEINDEYAKFHIFKAYEAMDKGQMAKVALSVFSSLFYNRKHAFEKLKIIPIALVKWIGLKQ